MRILTQIDRPLADEHVIGTDPPLSPNAGNVWRRRINPFTGRALSDVALTAQQNSRAGMQRLRGLGVTAGIVAGLDLTWEPTAMGAAPADAIVQILPGSGLTRDGEDITIPTPRRIALGELPVFARVDHLNAIESGAAASGVLPEPAAGGGLAPLLPRRLGGMLGSLLEAPAADDLPRVAILVAQPVTATINATPKDLCPPDPRDDPYDDLRRIDGARLLLVLWPSEQVASGGVPDYSLPAPGSDRRNRLAYRIFDVESAQAADIRHPWEEIGMPIALVGFNDDWTLDFVDCASVVRMGGQAKPRTSLVSSSGSPLLWQARVAQFAEQIAELDTLTTATLTASFRELPPVGFLPSQIVDLVTRRQHFFPAGFGISMAPVPLEDLGAAVNDSASLAPINLDAPGDVELLVPVPERVYEPGLLETAVVDPAFGRATSRYVADRTDWLVRREMVRRRRDLLSDSLDGTIPAFPSSDFTATELLPYPDDRGPVTTTRMRHVDAGGAVRSLQMMGAHSSLIFAKGDAVYVWVRITAGALPGGLALRFASGSTSAAANFSYGVFWGSADQLPIAAGDGSIGLRRQGDLPAPGQWVRLQAPSDARWAADGGLLSGLTVNGVAMEQSGGTIDWGPIGRIAADGSETIWIADDAPPGASLRDSASANAAIWPDVATGISSPPVEADLGTVDGNGVRASIAIGAFRDRWLAGSPFMAADFTDLEEGGIDGFIAAVGARLRATNDAIDAGFVRARSDIYRVRQVMLGADAASRMVTSPSLADLSTRAEGARAQSADLASYLKTAYDSSPTRDADNPLLVLPKTRTPTPAPVPSDHGTRINTLFLNSFKLSETSTLSHSVGNIGAAKFLLPTPAPAPLVISPFLFGGGTTGKVGSAVSTLRASTALTEISLAGFAAQSRTISVLDIQAERPLPSFVERTLSVAERLPPSPATEAFEYATAGKFAVVTALAGLLGDPKGGPRPAGIALADLPAPGFTFTHGDLPAPPTVRGTIGDVIRDRREATGDYADADALGTNQRRHEADYFSGAVNAIDNTVAMMRLVEGRVDLYNRLLSDAQSVRTTLQGQIHQAEARLRTIDVQVEEARQDVAVASALLAEEQARVDALNAKRRAVLDANVRAIVYRRPRRADRNAVIPVVSAVAALVESPVTACLRDHAEVPEELREYAALFRDAAVQWFPSVRDRVSLIDRLDAARATLVAVKIRAATPLQISVVRTDNAPKMLTAVHQVIAAQRSTIDQRRLSALQVDAVSAASYDLSSAHLAIIRHASIGDLIAGDHHRAALASAAAAEMETVGQVAGCLHSSFGETPPALRLQWAEILSEFDRSAPLSRLSGLAGWSNLPIETRRTQQGFVDWLFSRIDRSIAPAEAAMNELVRIALLLAAHAPVDRLIPARLIAPAPARIGVRLDLAVDVAVARTGMTALIRSAAGVVIAHSVVDDIAEGVARTRIVKVFNPSITTIEATMVAHLSDAVRF